MRSLTIQLLIVLTVCGKVHSKDIVNYLHYTRDLAVSSLDETTLIFPSPPITLDCHPSGVVDLHSVQSVSDLRSASLPQGVQLMEELGEAETQDEISKITAKILRLIPLKRNGNAKCSVKLANNETVNIKFLLKSDTSRPLIQFQSLHRNATKSGLNYDSIHLEAFRIIDLMESGGKLLSFIEITPSKSSPKTYSKPSGNYKIKYIGTDNANFKAWIIEYKSTYSQKLSHILKGTEVNEFYSSLFVNPKKRKIQRWVDTNEVLYLYLVTRQDIEVSDVLEKLK